MAEASGGASSRSGVIALRFRALCNAISVCGSKWHKCIARFIGLVLLGAAALKVHQLATEHLLEDGWLGSRAVHVTAVEFELALGSLLLFGAWARVTWAVTFTTFGAFAGVSLAALVQGKSSCGCFGTFQIHPLYALVLDVVVLALLAWAPPTSHRGDRDRYPRSRFAYSAIILLVIIAGTVRFFSMDVAVIGADGIAFMQGGVVLLDPAKWLDSAFPLIQHIKGGAALTEGSWTVVLYRHDCPACRALLDERRQTPREASVRLALIEVPPSTLSRVHVLPEGVRMQLDPAFDWEVRVPVQMKLQDGVVRSIAP